MEDRTTTAVEVIPPAMASQLVDTMVHKRPVRNVKRDAYARDMASGLWKVGPPLMIDRDGHLLDGQHRLQAVLKTGVPVTFLVIRGLDPDTFHVLDQGAKRNIGDVLRMRGEQRFAELQAALVTKWRWDKVKDRPDRRMPSGGGSIGYPTVDEALALLERLPTMRASVERGTAVGRAVHFSRGITSWLHYEFSQLDADDAELFFDKLASGTGLDEDSPIRVARNQLLNAATPSPELRDTERRAAWVVKAWNAYRRGAPTSLLKWSPGGRSPEPFPVPQ
jgi:hypothetical protein